VTNEISGNEPVKFKIIMTIILITFISKAPVLGTIHLGLLHITALTPLTIRMATTSGL
jgi:hypothetical protein